MPLPASTGRAAGPVPSTARKPLMGSVIHVRFERSTMTCRTMFAMSPIWRNS